MHKSATKCNETIGKWCKNKHGASKIIDTLETYQPLWEGKEEVVFFLLRMLDSKPSELHVIAPPFATTEEPR
jgi:hypothetical protein